MYFLFCRFRSFLSPSRYRVYLIIGRMYFLVKYMLICLVYVLLDAILTFFIKFLLHWV